MRFLLSTYLSTVFDETMAGDVSQKAECLDPSERHGEGHRVCSLDTLFIDSFSFLFFIFSLFHFN